VSQCHSVHHISRMDWPGIEHGTPRLEDESILQSFRSYRAVNTFRLGYKNQSVNAV